MFGDFMGKMQEAQEKMEEAKSRMDTVYVDAEVEGGLVKVSASANKRIKSIEISEELLDDKEAIEELVTLACNRAIEKAESVYEAEMARVANQYMGGMPGMGGF